MCDYQILVSVSRGLFEVKFVWNKQLRCYDVRCYELSVEIQASSVDEGLFRVRMVMEDVLDNHPPHVPELKDAGKKLRRFYISGPMSGREELNKYAFIEAATNFRGKNFEVFSPYDYSQAINLGEGVVKNSRRYLLNADMGALCLWADSIVMLEEWEISRGAKAELYTAMAMDLPVIFYSDVLASNFTFLDI